MHQEPTEIGGGEFPRIVEEDKVPMDMEEVENCKDVEVTFFEPNANE